MKSIHLATSSLAAILIAAAPSIALAQDASSPDAAGASAQDLQDMPTEIIVTATRRAEKLTEVPIAISVFSGANIEQTNVRELSEIGGYIPNVEISQHNDSRAVITIRGVGSYSRNIGFDSRVGVYVDGVYLGQSPAVNQELLDLERVEVLRGPQGMLFGKNTVAGAVSLVTRKPTQRLEGMVSADLGNYDFREFKGHLNVPLGETLAVKVSASKTDRDGYVTNTVTGNDLGSRDVTAYRAQLRFAPSPEFEANFAFDGLNASNRVLVGKAVSDTFGLFPDQSAPEPETVAFDFDPAETRNLYGGLADLEYRFDSGYTVKSITGYRDTYSLYENDTDYSPQSIVFVEYEDRFEQWSEELQLLSPSEDRLTWMLGAYLYKQTAETRRDAVLGSDFYEGFVGPLVGPSVAPLLGLDPNALTQADLATIASIVGIGPEGSRVYNSGTVTTESIAVYLNGSYEFTPRLKLGFGARYSIETKDVTWLLDGRAGGSVLDIGVTNPDAAGNPQPLDDSHTDRFLATAASLSYDFADDVTGYAKYSSGYKSGGFNLDYVSSAELAANEGLEFAKETVDSYEIGLKTSLFDRRVALNLAGFIANYEDYQVNQFVDLGGGQTTIRITNAAEVETRGIELEATLRATDSLTLQGSAGVLDATYAAFPGGGSGGSDISGNRLASAPKFSGSAGATYARDLDSRGTRLTLHADLTHTGGYFTTEDNVKTSTLALGAQVPFGYIDDTTLVNARAALALPGDHFELAVWARNLTDERGALDSLRDFFGTIVESPRMGRTYGVTVTGRF
ncbi:TonB-dependent receptor [Alteriqipengyuania lutimaris]|uniref:TonB-dependent receptor n=1 Tax=Alteriqipengyuania lutimaris TaxID=1538146 RepID=A0A395LI15_9SPHN|nr:TonB-dependent receptor [Alteriqipengyuania lutimaris]MBB3034862.1 iron complex outermembrane receptor protein [Alteriqipengyuania lutimaris]RDS76305.1 TonB-dependent receptor [Alteriqipengyuania lutimaris]